MPLIERILSLVARFQDHYFYEWELQNQNLIVTQATEASDNAASYDFMMINQPIPFIYRHLVQNVLQDVFGEKEYEFNQVCQMKKIAAFFITLATKNEPEKQDDLLLVC